MNFYIIGSIMSVLLNIFLIFKVVELNKMLEKCIEINDVLIEDYDALAKKVGGAE